MSVGSISTAVQLSYSDALKKLNSVLELERHETIRHRQKSDLLQREVDDLKALLAQKQVQYNNCVRTLEEKDRIIDDLRKQSQQAWVEKDAYQSLVDKNLKLGSKLSAQESALVSAKAQLRVAASETSLIVGVIKSELDECIEESSKQRLQIVSLKQRRRNDRSEGSLISPMLPKLRASPRLKAVSESPVFSEVVDEGAVFKYVEILSRRQRCSSCCDSETIDLINLGISDISISKVLQLLLPVSISDGTVSVLDFRRNALTSVGAMLIVNWIVLHPRKAYETKPAKLHLMLQGNLVVADDLRKLLVTSDTSLRCGIGLVGTVHTLWVHFNIGGDVFWSLLVSL